MSDTIQLTYPTDQIALLTLNRPRVLNALNWEMMNAFAETVRTVQENPDLRVLILTGAGARAFCAGGDIKQLHQFPNYEDGQRLTEGMTDALTALETLPYPTIAALNGVTRGGGAEIALATDIRLIDETADIGFTQIMLGLPPGWGSGGRLLRLVGYSRALEMLASGRVLRAEEAVAWGLVNAVIPEGMVMDAALKLAKQIAAHPPEAVRADKTLLRAALHLPPNEAAQVEQDVFAPRWVSDTHLQLVEQFLARKSS